MTLKTTSAKAGPKTPAKAGKTLPKVTSSTKTAPTPGRVTAAPKAKPAVVVTIKHLASSIAEQQNLPQKQANLLLTNLIDLMVDHLKQGDRLRINGLGILEVKSRPARMGRNPATGETIQIKASKKIAFRAAKDLKEAV